MSTSITPGVLSVVHESVERVREALDRVHDNLSALPVIFEQYGHVANRGPRLETGEYDKDFWGVDEISVRRYRFTSSIVELGWSEGFNLYTAHQAVCEAFKTTWKNRAEDLRATIELCDSAEQAVDAIRNLIAEIKAETKAPVVVDETEALDGDETETETDPVETDKVLRWLQAPAGSLRKVLEAVQGGHIFTDEQRSAFDEILSIATSIAGAQAFVPAPVAVNA